MKLLLTSGGLTTPEMRAALADLVGKEMSETNLVLIPTAANLEAGDKRWLIEDLNVLDGMGFQSIDVMDISAVPKSVWLPRLEAADVFLLGGGNTYHLLHWVKQSGLVDELPRLLKDRVYVGISAGSVIAGLSLGLCTYEQEAARATGEDPGNEGLGLVPFVIEPHLGNPHFPEISVERTKTFAVTHHLPMYLLDDTGAVMVNGSETTVLGQTHYLFEGRRS